MAIHLEPDKRILAFRIDGGPWMFNEELLHIWVQAGEAIEQPDLSSFDWKTEFERFMQTQIISRNGHFKNANLRQED